MVFDSDVALVGTGVAPLVAAHHLLIQGKSVLLLNPDWDFFLEDSELPLDPLFLKSIPLERIKRNAPEKVLEELRPDFPGAIEFWSSYGEKIGFHDPFAPHVRQRSRLWISSSEKDRHWNWENLEDLYVLASDAGLNPQILEGVLATRKFPGCNSHIGNYRGLLIPKFCDVDTVRYRTGLLEYLEERLGPERIIRSASQIDWMPGGVRFRSGGTPATAKLKDGVLIFWTPRLNSWVFNQLKKTHTPAHLLPQGIQIWEHWSILSKEKLDPTVVGMIGDVTVWSEVEGSPVQESTGAPSRLSILRPSSTKTLGQYNSPHEKLDWASAESFEALSNLSSGFLRWDRFSISSLRTRATLDWSHYPLGHEDPWLISKEEPVVHIVPGSDGPLFDVVRVARKACQLFIGEGERE